MPRIGIEEYQERVAFRCCLDCAASAKVCINCLSPIKADYPLSGYSSELSNTTTICPKCLPLLARCGKCRRLRLIDSLTEIKEAARYGKICTACITDWKHTLSISATTNTIGGKKATFKIMPMKRRFGYELECMTTSPAKLRSLAENCGFGVTIDGSVGGSGTEVQTSPLMGDEGWSVLNMFLTKMKKMPTVTDHRCGVHLHIETKDLSQWELVKVYVLYYLVQHHLYSMQTHRRRNNYFCIHIKDTDVQEVVKYGVEYFLYANRFIDPKTYSKEYKKVAKEDIEDKGHSKRYYFLNMHSHFFRGTIENRMHMNSLDNEDLYHWAIINGTLIEKAKTMTASEILKVWGRRDFLRLFRQKTQENILKRWGAFGCDSQRRTTPGVLASIVEPMKKVELTALKDPDNPYEVIVEGRGGKMEVKQEVA